MRVRVFPDTTGELAAVVAGELARRGHEVVERGAEAIINLGRQAENTLLSDGWAWNGAGRRLPEQIAAIVKTAAADEPRIVVDASAAFLYGAVESAKEDASLVAPGGKRRFRAYLEAEAGLRSAGLPVTTLRLGYGYGPRYKDLKRYRSAIRLGRPYYPGPGLPAPWLHHDDAAVAIVNATEKAAPGSVYNVADELPVSLREFIDHFGRRELHWFTWYLPRWSLKALGGQIREEQILLLDQRTTVDCRRARADLGWTPRYRSYREGLLETVGAWKRV